MFPDNKAWRYGTAECCSIVNPILVERFASHAATNKAQPRSENCGARALFLFRRQSAHDEKSARDNVIARVSLNGVGSHLGAINFGYCGRRDRMIPCFSLTLVHDVLRPPRQHGYTVLFTSGCRMQVSLISVALEISSRGERAKWSLVEMPTRLEYAYVPSFSQSDHLVRQSAYSQDPLGCL